MNVKGAIMRIFPEIPEFDEVDFSQYSTPYAAVLEAFLKSGKTGLREFEEFVEENGGTKADVGKFLISIFQYLLIRYRRYGDEKVELVGYTTCGGCPGGNVEYAPAEMKKNGAEIIHLATGLVVGYPPCPYLNDFGRFIPAKYGLEVVIGTHPIPQNYYLTHQELGTWQSAEWQERIRHVLTDVETRLAYD